MRTNLLSMLLVVAVQGTSGARDLSEYRIGDRIEEEVVAPVPLVVMDAEATAELKAKEAGRIPVIYRFDQSIAVGVIRGMHDKFAEARTNFLALMERSFRRPQLEEHELESDQFARLMGSFRKRDADFPLTLPLAREWALGRDGASEHEALMTRVQAAFEQPMRDPNATNAPKGGNRVLLIPVNDPTVRLTAADMERGISIPRTNLTTLFRVRQELTSQLSSLDQKLVRYATRHLAENTFVETELTLAARARHADPFFVADHYQAGQIVARPGQLVDRKVLAALTQIQEKTIAGRLQEQVIHQKQQTAQAQVVVTQVRQSNRILFWSLMGASGLLLVAFTWLVLRRKPGTVGVPALVSVSGAVGSPAEAAWQQRALQAENQAERAEQAIRSGVMDQLKDKAVHSLAVQRAEMLEAQNLAALEMAELERRLNEVHAPLQERLQAYQSRITELEQALAAKDAQNRDLLRAKVELMRQRLELERKGDKLQFN